MAPLSIRWIRSRYSGRPAGGLHRRAAHQRHDDADGGARSSSTPRPAPADTPGTRRRRPGHRRPVLRHPARPREPRVVPEVAAPLSGIRGPLAVEGGTTTADRSLVAGVLLPGEANGPFFNIPPQPPETQSIDVLNIYNDGTKGSATGMLTSTALTGLNMGRRPRLHRRARPGRHPFGESGKYPGGISYGSIVRRSRTTAIFSDRRAATRRIEVAQHLPRLGQRHLDINSTLIPGPDHNADGTLGFVSEQGGITTVHGGGNAPLQLIANNPAGYPFGNVRHHRRRRPHRPAGAHRRPDLGQ